MIGFDAEPLIAFYGDEPGSDAVDARIRPRVGGTGGAVNAVTGTEVHCVVRRDDERRADEYRSRIRNWFRVIDARPVWEEPSFFKHRYGVPPGDAFTLATARVREGTAFVDAEDRFDDVSEVPIERFRSEPA